MTCGTFTPCSCCSERGCDDGSLAVDREVVVGPDRLPRSEEVTVDPQQLCQDRSIVEGDEAGRWSTSAEAGCDDITA